MASSIDTSTIDANYPVAGIDNDSQGFRDNFNSIKTNITTAGSEITALQANRARTDADNNHVGNEIQDAELLQVTEKFNNSSQTLTGDHEVDYRDAHVHQFNATAPAGNIMTVSFVGWPTNRYAKLRVIMSVSSGVSTNITLSPGSGTGLNDNNAAWVGGNNILTHTGSIGQKIIVDVFTYDTGNNLFFNYVGSFD
ncbi:hypothetical protein N9993_00345 [bacterium]|jgi:hypothetical protein|nr:hypothetical protein [bacterium]